MQQGSRDQTAGWCQCCASLLVPAACVTSATKSVTEILRKFHNFCLKCVLLPPEIGTLVGMFGSLACIRKHCPPLTDEQCLGDAGDGDGVGDAVPLAAAPRRHDLVRRRHQRPRLLQRRGVHIGYCYSMLRPVSQNTKDEGRYINSIKLHTPRRVHRAGGRAA